MGAIDVRCPTGLSGYRICRKGDDALREAPLALLPFASAARKCAAALRLVLTWVTNSRVSACSLRIESIETLVLLSCVADTSRGVPTSFTDQWVSTLQLGSTSLHWVLFLTCSYASQRAELVEQSLPPSMYIVSQPPIRVSGGLESSILSSQRVVSIAIEWGWTHRRPRVIVSQPPI